MTKIAEEVPETFSEVPASEILPPPPDLEPVEEEPVHIPKKRGPYKKGPKTPEAIETPPPQTPVAPPTILDVVSPEMEKKFREAGQKSVVAIISILGNLNSDFRPIEPQEQEAANAFVKAGGEYFVSKQWGDLPPGLAFALAGMSYLMVVSMAPRNKGLFDRMKNKFVAWRANRNSKSK